VLPSPVRVARAIAVLASHREARERAARTTAAIAGARATLPGASVVGKKTGTLSEAESKALLERIGIAVTQDVLVQSAADQRLDELTPPFAVKIASPDIPHKTEIGGVKLNIRTRTELQSAIGEVLQNARTKAPHAKIEGVIVSEMVTGGFELLAGALNDPVFGPVLVVGAGGIYAEAFGDKSLRLAPFDEDTAREMIGELKCSAILRGVRGQAPLDVDAVARVLSALSRFAWDNRDTIAEVDVNPLFALPNGAVAADALIIARSEA
jgi:acyl-CoA synthetase (NDP forming)